MNLFMNLYVSPTQLNFDALKVETIEDNIAI